MKNRAKTTKALVDLLENDYNFRNYRILPISKFSTVNKQGIHCMTQLDDLEHDIDNTLQTFHRDGYSEVFFYI